VAAQRRAETTELRTALLSAVGHDLRTPLTSIKAAVSSLRDAELVRPQLRAVGYDEVVAQALSTVDPSDTVAVDVGEELPPMLADPGLLERVVANVVDNALRHGSGAAVEVRGSAHAGRVELRVCDRGPGLPRGAAEIVFAPFQRLGSAAPGSTARGDRQTAPGIGLGLSVAKGFVVAMGGTISPRTPWLEQRAHHCAVRSY
jgi:two-component system sensor histidine kinase KdpD